LLGSSSNQGCGVACAHKMLRASKPCYVCRPLPASSALSKSTSLGSAGRLHPQPAQPNILDEGEDVVAEQPMQSPFGSPPPVGLPERHLGPPVQEEHLSHVAAAATTANGSLLISPAAREFSYTFASHSGSETGHGRVSNTHAPASHYLSQSVLAVFLQDDPGCIAAFSLAAAKSRCCSVMHGSGLYSTLGTMQCYLKCISYPPAQLHVL